jgi:preprotein translocase subunit SecF
MSRPDVESLPYDDYSNRQLAAVPLVLLAVALAILGGAFLLSGTPIDLGMAFTGGTEVRFDADASGDEIRATLDDVDIESLRSVGQSDSYLLQTQTTDPDEATAIEEEIAQNYDVLSVEVRSASFGADTQQQAILGVIIAFVGMSLIVALIFRTFVPSLAIVASAFSDIMIPLAVMSLFSIQLTLGTVAALLMIIGYSVDSDILLNNHVLNRHGGFYESTFRAMRTGVSMTVTSISAMVMMFIVATLFGIPLLPDIALVLVLGLTADLINTYLMNVSLLRWYKYEGVTR